MLFLIGLLVGFLGSVPPGPINIFSISQALRFGLWKSMSIRLVASGLDALYCYFFVVFTSHLASLVNRWIFVLRLIGSLVMVVAGLYLLRLARAHRVQRLDFSSRPPRRGNPAALTFLLYVSSPTLPFFWLTIATVFTSYGLVTHQGFKPIFLALSCGMGSLLYYMIVAKLGEKLQTVMRSKFFETVYTVLGAVLLVLAAITGGLAI